jgi:serine/threonine protein kinase/HAMP domain-containing protein
MRRNAPWAASAGAAVDISSGRDASSRYDPRVASALEEYLDALNAGRPPSRETFLARHAEIATDLEGCLDVLEFVRSGAFEASSDVEDSPRTWPVPATSRLGDFRILREVGRGGMGVVYEAEQVSLRRRVALKVLSLTSKPDPKQRKRFQIEAQAAALLAHPHIVPVYVVGSDQGVDYYAMQFIQGRSLSELVRGRRQASGRDVDATTRDHRVAEPAFEDADISTSRSPDCGPSRTVGVDPRVVARLGLQAADALEHAHGLGVIHRDVKPANLMVDDRGCLWVTDFGLARVQASGGPTRSGDMLGTFRYMSPEQARADAPVDHRTDVYSLGATLYELATLSPALDDGDRGELLRRLELEEPPAPSTLVPSIPRDLETIILKAMAKAPSSRYSSAGAMADDLGRFLDGVPILARRPGVQERLARWSMRHRTALASAAGTLLLATLTACGLLWSAHRRTARALDRLERLRENERATLPQIFANANALAMNAMQRVSTLERLEAGKEKEEFYRLALDYYEPVAQATQDDPDPAMREVAAKAHFGVGLARALLKVPGEEEAFRSSVAAYEELCRLDPNKPGFRIHLAASLRYLAGEVHSARGLGEAEPIYLRLVDLVRGLVAGDPGSTEYRGYLARELTQWGEILAIEGRRTEAERIIVEAAGLDPGAAAAPNALAWLLAARPDLKPHDPSRAVSLGEKAVKLEPDEPNSWNTLGVARFRAGDRDGAVQALERSSLLHKGGEPVDWLFLAMIHAQKGETDRAKGYVDRTNAWLAQHPDDDPDLSHFRAEAADWIARAATARAAR